VLNANAGEHAIVNVLLAVTEPSSVLTITPVEKLEGCEAFLGPWGLEKYDPAQPRVTEPLAGICLV